MKAINEIRMGGVDVLPLVEGGKGIGVSTGVSSGHWAAAGGAGTFSALRRRRTPAKPLPQQPGRGVSPTDAKTRTADRGSSQRAMRSASSPSIAGSTTTSSFAVTASPPPSTGLLATEPFVTGAISPVLLPPRELGLRSRQPFIWPIDERAATLSCELGNLGRVRARNCSRRSGSGRRRGSGNREAVILEDLDREAPN